METSPGAGSQGQGDRLTVRTVAVPGPVDLIGQLPGPDALAWVRSGDGLVGWGETARVVLPAGEDRFTAGEKWLRALFEGADVEDQVGEPGCGPVAFGSFTFDGAGDGSVLVVPATVVGQRHGRAWVTTISPAADAGPAPVRPSAPAEVRWHDGSLGPPEWEHAVASAVRWIKQGRLRKVVLARDLYAHASDDIDTRVLLHRLAGRYPSCYTFACAGLVGATPELLISRRDADIRSLVLAGTAPRGHDAAQDAALAAGLLSSAKDAEEHSYVVAGVRAALAARCSRLSVDTRPSLVRLANVQHLGTHVTGQLASTGDAFDHSVLALVAALHPTGAVCGTPAETAMEVIRELEGMDRGRYAGPVGWVDAGGNGEWGIALRCAEVEGPWARLFAGCGIVAGSDPVAELAEAQAKFHPMKCAIEG
ncbi:MAG TPA: isochorismate synthase [Streptosporangiaceae bacterium]|nr:isochorismate synthase [Streptosporangiaceae bacterium]